MEKEILIPTKALGKIQRAFSKSRMTIWNALNYRSGSDLARKIRHVALKQYGGLISTGITPEGFMPDCDTEFDHANGLIRQTFGDRLKITIDKKKNTAAIEADGKPVATLDDMTLNRWCAILYCLQQVVNDMLNE